MTRRALGRGLSALLSDKPATTSEEMVEIDLDLIEPNNFQPRTSFDEERLEQLAQSIRANGIIQPLLVRRISSERYQLVAGERRWRAAQRAGLLVDRGPPQPLQEPHRADDRPGLPRTRAVPRTGPSSSPTVARSATAPRPTRRARRSR